MKTNGCGERVKLGDNNGFICGGRFGLCDRCEIRQLKEANEALVEACEAARKVLDTDGENDLDEWEDARLKLTAALAKAKGQP